MSTETKQHLPKITVQCQSCGLTLKDYPALGPTLPLRCPNCGNHEDKVWKEIKPRLWVPMSAGRRIIRSKGW